MSNIPAPQGYINTELADRLLKRWLPVLDHVSENVKAIQNPRTRINTAILLENQDRWLVENNLAQSGGVFGTTQSGTQFSSDFYATGDARLPKIIIPMVRRTFPELMTNEIVGVQPMSGPVGMAFALRYKYEADPLGATQTDNLYGYTGANTVPGARASSDGYEMGYNKLNTAFTGTSSANLSGGEHFEAIADDQGVAQLLNAFEMTSNIGKAVLTVEKKSVEAGKRMISTSFSIETEQDIKNMMGIDISNELVNTMSYEIQAEIDREIVMRMIQVTINAGVGNGFSLWYAASADARWSAERGRDLYNKILVESNRLAIRNRRGAANFIVATPSVCAILQSLKEFMLFPVQSTVNSAIYGSSKVGVLAGQFTVYRDTKTEAQYQQGSRLTRVEFALLGYKGPDFHDTGLVYCPYIPLMIQQTVGQNDFTPRIGLMTRYAIMDHLFGASLYYHTIFVKGLGESFTPGSTSVYL